jgi:hypothetical protein
MVSEESKVRSDIVAILKPLLAFPVENTAAVGCPDVCCLLGWVEVKLAERPVRHDTRVDVAVRPAQRLWMRAWSKHGGHCWWLTRLRGGTDLADLWTLHIGGVGADHLGHWTERQMIQHALWHEQRLNSVPPDFVKVLLAAVSR